MHRRKSTCGMGSFPESKGKKGTFLLGANTCPSGTVASSSLEIWPWSRCACAVGAHHPWSTPSWRLKSLASCITRRPLHHAKGPDGRNPRSPAPASPIPPAPPPPIPAPPSSSLRYQNGFARGEIGRGFSVSTS
jgi:hypothetical protein